MRRSVIITKLTTNRLQYIMNTPIFKGLVYQRASDLFVQWRDPTTIYGLSFAAVPDAEQFTQCLDECIKKLQEQQCLYISKHHHFICFIY
jgi:hypothetical protein